jgi:hypothetical protein
MQKISALEQAFNQQHAAGAQTDIERFASDPKHMFFDNVRGEMSFLLQSGKAVSLGDAYDKACWADKEIRELLIKQQALAAHARRLRR